MRVKDRGTVVAEIPNTALVDEAPIYDRPDRAAGLSGRGAAARCRQPVHAVVARRGIERAADVADHRQQALGLSPVRPHGPHQHARAGRHGRGRGAGQGHVSCAGGVDRRQRPLRLSRSAARRDARRGRGRAQRRVCRRGADRRHQLPEFRQPAAPGDHVAAGRVDRGHRRGVPRARRADHRRQRQPLQRDGRQGDLSRRRRSAWSA